MMFLNVSLISTSFIKFASSYIMSPQNCQKVLSLKQIKFSKSITYELADMYAYYCMYIIGMHLLNYEVYFHVSNRKFYI